ncbi:MAG: hypothetical protein BGP06_08240 [Rhizobiales bacterium 65-9]|nr:MAG: hypothetical protein BGP06_08240 [Rhizobiales bacterium 65-9]
MVSRVLSRRMDGYGLTTAQILYRLPDHPKILQSYVWQDYDLAPRFPELRKFLDFWRRTLEGPIFEVTIAHSTLVRAVEMRSVSAEITLH